ncbi:MAG TPA: hypothetical protein VGE47_02315, partial [Burkholderiaceae bacterium]
GKRLAREDRAQQLEREGRSQGYLDRGFEQSTGYLKQALDSLAPVRDLGTQYNRAGTTLMDSLGLNGADGNARATQAFQASPGYDYQVEQALEGTLRKANAAGGLGGNALSALQDRAGQLANAEYGNWRNSLSGLAGLGANVTMAGAQGTGQGYTNLANLATGYGLNSSNLIQQVGQGVSRTYAQKCRLLRREREISLDSA